MSSEPKSHFWKPGEARPSGLSSKKKKKKRKRKNRKIGKGGEEQEDLGTSSSGLPAASDLRGSVGNKRRREERGEKETTSDAVFSSIPSRSNDYYIKSSGETSQAAGTKRPRFSESLRKLKFMSRKKKKPRAKEEEKKWVLPSSAASSAEAVDGSKKNKLVCTPMESRPVARSRFGRRSFKSFNRSVDNFTESLVVSKGDKKVAEYVEETAIGQEEMSEFQQRIKSRR